MKKVILMAVMALCLATTAHAACDAQKVATEFAQFLQTFAQKNPEKFAEAQTQSDLQTLMTEVATLAGEGKVDAICEKYETFQKKY